MTGTLTTPAATIAAGIGLRGRQARLLLSECTKFRTLRSTVYTPLIAVVLMIGIGFLGRFPGALDRLRAVVRLRGDSDRVRRPARTEVLRRRSRLDDTYRVAESRRAAGPLVDGEATRVAVR